MNDKPPLNPDYTLASHENLFDGNPIVTEEDIAWIESQVGRGGGCWEMNTEATVLAAWKRFVMKLKQECP